MQSCGSTHPTPGWFPMCRWGLRRYPQRTARARQDADTLKPEVPLDLCFGPLIHLCTCLLPLPSGCLCSLRQRRLQLSSHDRCTASTWFRPTRPWPARCWPPLYSPPAGATAHRQKRRPLPPRAGPAGPAARAHQAAARRAPQRPLLLPHPQLPQHLRRLAPSGKPAVGSPAPRARLRVRAALLDPFQVPLRVLAVAPLPKRLPQPLQRPRRRR
jgi:hypothetical protein